MATTYLQPATPMAWRLTFWRRQREVSTISRNPRTIIGHTWLFNAFSPPSIRSAWRSIAVGVHRYNAALFFPVATSALACIAISRIQTVVGITGGPSIGVSTAIQAPFIPTTWTIGDDVTLVRGAHQFGFGGTAFRYQSSSNANVYSAASALPSQWNGYRRGPGVDFVGCDNSTVSCKVCRTLCS